MNRSESLREKLTFGLTRTGWRTGHRARSVDSFTPLTIVGYTTRMRFDATIHIRRDPAEVFAFVCDPTNDRRWRTGVVEGGLSSDGPIGVGTTGYAKARQGTREIRADWRVTEYEENRRVSWTFLSGPLAGGGGYRVTPSADGTRFTLVADLRFHGFGKLMGPLFWFVGGRQNRRDVQKLKAILEAR